MYYQRKLHDAFAGKSVAARARRAAFDVAAEADAEIARLQAQAQEDVRRRADLTFALDSKDAEIRRLRSTIQDLRAQVDALTKAGEQALAWMESAWDRIDGEWGPCGRTLTEACKEGCEPEIAGLRAALTADVASSTH